jgi:soluble lytic murein transglycosylase-like protein
MIDLSTPQLRLAFVTPTAQKYGLEPALVCAVCEQESGWEPGQARFEPEFLRHYVNPLNLPLLEAFDRATSWGLMQIMGQTAVELGCTGDLSALRTPDLGVTYGCKKLQKCFFAAAGDPTKALLRYNGGGNANYAPEVLARVIHYRNL